MAGHSTGTPASGPTPTSVLWFRRDLRLGDHRALAEAAASGHVLPLVVLDPTLLERPELPRAAWYLANVAALSRDLAGLGAELVIRVGQPEVEVPRVAQAVGASHVFISAEFTPYGQRRDQAVAAALSNLPGAPDLIGSDSPYAVAPGAITNGSGETYKVFTPFYRTWSAANWGAPAAYNLSAVNWLLPPPGASAALPDCADHLPEHSPEPGEHQALAIWHDFRPHLAEYAELRDRPDLAGTSRLSPYLKVGAIHPRTLLAEIGPEGEAFRREIAFRDFYAAVLHRWPHSADDYFQPALRDLSYATGSELSESLSAWADGLTGFPFIDAGMRQLKAEGWMHNRLRMLVASFLVKDLRVEWMHGAQHFMDHLIDADLASNQHGWQWAAGSGTDAAPYFRIFNPVTQGKKFDPMATYIARWVPELRDLPPPLRHEPWKATARERNHYPAPIVDHSQARAAALADYDALRRRTSNPTPPS